MREQFSQPTALEIKKATGLTDLKQTVLYIVCIPQMSEAEGNWADSVGPIGILGIG